MELWLIKIDFGWKYCRNWPFSLSQQYRSSVQKNFYICFGAIKK